jgi:hypothetical protein
VNEIYASYSNRPIEENVKIMELEQQANPQFVSNKNIKTEKEPGELIFRHYF